MSEEYIDWKSRALAAEAETLNLKNLCAHHGICTACGEYYIHHHNEPFATCNCNTSEWYELTEYMKLQDELRKLREHGILLRQEAVVFDVTNLDAVADRLLENKS